MRVVVALAFAFAITAAAAAEPGKTGPAWAQLTVEQQQILAPLKQSWNTLDSTRRRKWIGIAQRYPSMQPKEQERVRQRMDRWAKLTPDQRRAAREQYRSIGKLPPEKRQDLKQQWREYQSLSPTEKRKFEASSTTDKPRKRSGNAPPGRGRSSGASVDSHDP